MIASLLIRLIEKYQRRGGGLAWFNVDCNFEPTCSEYGRQALLKYGLARGIRMSFARIKSCSDKGSVERISHPLK